MQALVKDYNGEQFVYIPVKYTKVGFYTLKDERIYETNIVDISRDNRSQYVICSHCGAMIKNTPEAIEAHKAEQEKKRDCFTCKHMKTGFISNSNRKRKFKPALNNPGNYIIKETWSTNCYCDYVWRNPDINSEEAKSHCKYCQCRHAEMTSFTDTFLKYPGLFNVLPTVDMLLQKNWKFEYIMGDYITYHHPRMTTLKAYVNSKGIVTQFCASDTTGTNYKLMYSKKYNQLFFLGGNNKYKISVPYNLIGDRRDSIFIKIKELF